MNLAGLILKIFLEKMSLLSKYPSFQRLSINLTFAACWLLIGSSVYSEDAPDISWTSSLGSSNTLANDVSIAIDGAIFITGGTEEDLEGQNSSGSMDAYLTKFSSNGEKLWTRLVGSTSIDRSQGLSIASDGSIYITGYSNGNFDGVANSGLADVFLTKYSSDGVKDWSRLLGTSKNEYSNGVSTASDGSIYITGWSYSNFDGEVNNGQYDAFLTKYSSDGTKAWTKLLGTSGFEEAHSVDTATDGSVYITGFTYGALDGETHAGNMDAFLTKYSSDGTKAWTRLVGTSSIDRSRAVSIASDGSIYIAGQTYLFHF